MCDNEPKPLNLPESTTPVKLKRKKVTKDENSPNTSINESLLIKSKENEKNNNQNKILNYFTKAKKISQPNDTFGITIGNFVPIHLKPGMIVDKHFFIREAIDVDQFDRCVSQQNLNQPLETIKHWQSKKKQKNNEIKINENIDNTDDNTTFKVKFLKFHENYRPPYYGTWRNKDIRISARNPFFKNIKLDYDNESDLEWEEEEPGEDLLSDTEEQEVDPEGDNEDSEDSFLVPHGYLSEGEGISDSENESEDETEKIDSENPQIIPNANKITAQFKKLKPSVICFYCTTEDERLKELTKRTGFYINYPPDTSINLSTNLNKSLESERGKSKYFIPDEAIPILISILHNNTAGRKKIVEEFRSIWQSKYPEQAIIPKAQIIKKIKEVSERKSNKYIVNDKYLQQYSISSVRDDDVIFVE